MSIITKIKKFIGLDHFKDYAWLNSIQCNENWKKDRVVDGVYTLNGEGNCNLLLEVDAFLSLENNFQGIIIGKQNSTLRIKRKFSGIISCTHLIICGEADITGNLSAQTLIGKKNILFRKLNIKPINENQIFQLQDLFGLSIDEFESKYPDFYKKPIIS